ncbi:hypothetical protein HOF92_05565, partial [bacterium]|nr:hypothetical protein [bacterium]
NTTGSTANIKISTSIDTSARQPLEKTYRVKVRDGLATASRVASADVRIFLFPSLPPFVEAPRFITAKTNQTFILDASRSFDPERTGTLSFLWTFTGSPTLTPSSADSPVIEVTYATEGRYSGTLAVTKTNSDSTTVPVTRAIGIKIIGEKPPVAHAGRPIVLGQAEMVRIVAERGGLPMRNHSFSFETGEGGLSYSWEPANFFNDAPGAAVRHPLFNVTDPGAYEVTLTVTEDSTNQSASATNLITILKGQPPIANAGRPQVIRLGSSAQIVNLTGSRSISFVTDTLDYAWSGPTSFVGSTGTSSTAQISLDPNTYTERTELVYELTVTDPNGQDTGKTRVVVVPANRPPQAIVEIHPREPFYKSGQTVFLDASFSFSPDGLDLSFAWKFFGEVTLLEGDATSKEVLLQLPSVSNDTKLKVQLSVTDSRDNTKRVQRTLKIRANDRPPFASIDPRKLFLQAGTNPKPIKVSGAQSFSPSGSSLTYDWSVDTSLMRIVEGDSSSSTIALQAETDAETTFTEITLTVVDQNGLSAKANAEVLIEKRKDVDRPIFLKSEFAQTFDFNTFRLKPLFVEGVTFPTGGKYAYEHPGVFLFEKGDPLTIRGLAGDPNPGAVAYTVTGTLFEFDPGTETFSNPTALGTENDSSGRAEFSFSSSALTTAATWYAVEISAGSGTRQNTQTFPVQMRPEKVNQQPVAKPLIATIESQSLGEVVVATTTFSSVFPESPIVITLDGSNSTNPNGGGLKYQWETSFLGSLKEKKDAPNLLFLGSKKQKRLQFVWPIDAKKRTVEAKLTVLDEFSDTPSKSKAVQITLAEAQSIPPVADPGEYPVFAIASDQPETATIEVTLSAYESFSPVGNTLNFSWEYLGFADDPFAADADTVEEVVTLPQGKHPFRLTVTDATDADLSDSRFFEIEVRKERPREVGLLYDVDGFVDAFPIDAVVGEEVFIESKVYVGPVSFNQAEEPDPSKRTQDLVIEERVAGTVHTSLLGVPSQGNSVYTTSFDTAGEYVVEFFAWHDTNGDGFFDPSTNLNTDTSGDKSGHFRRKFIIRVQEHVEPISAWVDTGNVFKFRQSDGSPATVALTVTVDNPNTGTWDYLYKIGVFSASANAPASFTLNYGGSGTVTPSGSSVPTGRFKVEGTQDDSLTFSLTDLPNGEYQLDVQVFSKKGEVRLETFADEYFALVSSDLNVFLSLFDPEQELDLSTMSLQAYAVTSISTSLEGSQILSIAASSMVSVTGEDGAHYQFSLQNPYDFANALGGAEVSSGIHEIGGLLVRLFDHAAKNADQAVRLSEFREDVPTDGDW